jgi:hypothetical protein
MARPQVALLRHVTGPSINVYQGRVAEWLGRGLQNLLRWFESTRDLAQCSPF